MDGSILDEEHLASLFEADSDGYASGWVRLEHQDGPIFWHNGALSPTGHQSFIAYLPAEGSVFVLLAGIENGTLDLYDLVIPPLLGEPCAPQVNAWSIWALTTIVGRGVSVLAQIHIGALGLVLCAFWFAAALWRDEPKTQLEKLSGAAVYPGTALLFEEAALWTAVATAA